MKKQTLHNTIFTGFAPNVTAEDVRIACSYLFFPWKWSNLRTGVFRTRADSHIATYLGVSYAKTVDSGRSAILLALKAFDLKPGDEVLVPAYTCVVVINAITAIGAVPVYVDIQKNCTIDVRDAEKKISSKTKVLFLQHTFGIPVDIEACLALAKKYHLCTLEDCAHTFGARYKNTGYLGTVADIGMYSFGSDKSMSCGRGGAIVTNNATYAGRLTGFIDTLPKMPIKDVFQHLWHFPLFYVGKKTYGWGIGKILLWLGKNLHIMNRIITTEEKQGMFPKQYPAQLPNALAQILLSQLGTIDEYNRKRKEAANFYTTHIPTAIQLPTQSDMPLLRYPIFVQNPKALQHLAKQRRIFLGDWYQTPIAPQDIDTTKTLYQKGTCPTAEAIAQQSVNLPLNRYLTHEEQQLIVACINSYLEKNNG
jgi:dTDP-4-amino-4,6-dideoxygalactose transaminase